MVGVSHLGTPNSLEGQQGRTLASVKSKALSQDFFYCNYFEAGTSKGSFYILGLNSSAPRNSLSWASGDKRPLHHKCKYGPQEPKGWTYFCISLSTAQCKTSFHCKALSPFSLVLHLQYSQLLQVQTDYKSHQQRETTSPPCERSGSAAGREGWGSPAESALMRPQQAVAPGGNVL